MQRFNKTLFAILTAAGMLFASSCGSSPARSSDNAIYYWRTTFSLSDPERDFLREHDINRLYVRFFDVDFDYSSKRVEPVATIAFNDSVPAGISVVPVVYITTEAAKTMAGKEVLFAQKILRRVDGIAKFHGISYDEIQLDCDWNASTRDIYYTLCRELKSQIDTATTLSSTIRLHQLTQDAPPVDKGVLMVYNTGSFTQVETKNSIFSRDDIEPYLRDSRLSDYSLTLDVAYPIYGWGVVFKKVGGFQYGEEPEYEFYRLIHGTEQITNMDLVKISDNLYMVNRYFEFPNSSWENKAYLSQGDLIRIERPTAGEILEIKSMIEKQLKDKTHTNILYHLDENQLSHYSDNEISKIYSRD